MVAAIRTVGLAKSFGATVALRPLDLEVAEGEVLGYLGPDGAGKTTTIRCLPGMERASAGRAEIFGVDAQAHPAQAHRRVGYVPGEANLWPGLTGGEALQLLGRVQGKVDAGYRDELTGRFRLDPSRRVRTYSKGNRHKVLLVAALSSRAEPPGRHVAQAATGRPGRLPCRSKARPRRAGRAKAGTWPAPAGASWRTPGRPRVRWVSQEGEPDEPKRA